MTHSKPERHERLLQLQPQLEAFFTTMRQVIHTNRGEDALAGAQTFLLMLLHRKGASKVSDIAALIGITSGAITSMSDKMIETGLIRRERSESDRRVVHLSLTEAGTERARSIQGQRFDALKPMIERLSDDELEAMIRILAKMTSADPSDH